jgi:murein DD-endopeptidase MepM/ murein hydrolase activator NlpD
MRSCAAPTVLAMLLLLSCSATPGLASVRRDHPTTRLIGLASLPDSSRPVAGGIPSQAEPTRSPQLRLRPTVAIRPGTSAAGGATTARTKGASAPSPFGTILPRSDRAISLGWAGTRSPGAKPGPRARYRPPLAGLLSVLHRFQQPTTPYAAGHRGVDLAATSGQPVLAARGGRVQFAGPVAGRGVVVIAHADGIRTEYEPVAPTVRAGDAVDTGQVIGRILGTHGMCQPGDCLHWGARRGDVYIDPLLLLNPLGPVRLLPWIG